MPAMAPPEREVEWAWDWIGDEDWAAVVAAGVAEMIEVTYWVVGFPWMVTTEGAMVVDSGEDVDGAGVCRWVVRSKRSEKWIDLLGRQ